MSFGQVGKNWKNKCVISLVQSEKCTEELCPKCVHVLVLWMSKHELTLVPRIKYNVTCLGWVDIVFCIVDHNGNMKQFKYLTLFIFSSNSGNFTCSNSWRWTKPGIVHNIKKIHFKLQGFGLHIILIVGTKLQPFFVTCNSYLLVVNMKIQYVWCFELFGPKK